MNCEVKWRMGTMMFDVWFFESRGDGTTRLLQKLEGDLWQDEIVSPGTSVEDKPTLTLSEPMTKALAVALSDHLPPSAATDRHLEDAIKVRDRALDLLLSPRVLGPRKTK